MTDERQPKSLLLQSILWIVLPLSLVSFGLVLAGALVHQRAVTSLLIDRDRQLATLSAARLSEDILDLAETFEDVSAQIDPHQLRSASLDYIVDTNSELPRLFNAGIVLINRQGVTLSSLPADASPVGKDMSAEDFFNALRMSNSATFSDVTTDARTGQDMVLLAVPIRDSQAQFQGALLGAIHLHNTSLADPVRRLSVGDEGFAYLVDRRGRVIFHPDPDLIGTDFSQRPFVSRVMNGESGGLLWDDPAGVRLVLGYAPVQSAGWGLVIREPWETVIAPARVYAVAGGLAALVALMAMAGLLWLGVRRITLPIHLLDAQTRRLSLGEPLHPIQSSGILEVDALSQAFESMAAQIASYRSGLRRYLRAMTTSQEDERRRLALELHDETIQSLLAIERRIELLAATETRPQARRKLSELQEMVESAVQEVRQISRDLRPMALEDLGLAPALRGLVGAARNPDLPAPVVRFEMHGPSRPLPHELELALYRIAQEALSNVVKHAQASEARLSLVIEQGSVGLEIEDNGRGFDLPASSLAELSQSGHFGLLGIQERVWAVGGRLDIETSQGQGTRLYIRVDLEPPSGKG